MKIATFNINGVRARIEAGSLDPTDGGNSQRYALIAEGHQRDARGAHAGHHPVARADGHAARTRGDDRPGVVPPPGRGVVDRPAPRSASATTCTLPASPHAASRW